MTLPVQHFWSTQFCVSISEVAVKVHSGCIPDESKPHMSILGNWTLHSLLKPPSVTNKSFGLRTAASGNVGAAIVAHVALSGRSRIDAVIERSSPAALQKYVYKPKR